MRTKQTLSARIAPAATAAANKRENPKRTCGGSVLSFTEDLERFPHLRYHPHTKTRGRGGTGIRTSLRGWREQSLGGSSPLVRTKGVVLARTLSNPAWSGVEAKRLARKSWPPAAALELTRTLSSASAGGGPAFGWGYPPALCNGGRLAQLVRASRLHREGHRFESCAAHHCTAPEDRERLARPPKPKGDGGFTSSVHHPTSPFGLR